MQHLAASLIVTYRYGNGNAVLSFSQLHRVFTWAYFPALCWFFFVFLCIIFHWKSEYKGQKQKSAFKDCAVSVSHCYGPRNVTCFVMLLFPLPRGEQQQQFKILSSSLFASEMSHAQNNKQKLPKNPILPNKANKWQYVFVSNLDVQKQKFDS